MLIKPTKLILNADQSRDPSRNRSKEQHLRYNVIYMSRFRAEGISFRIFVSKLKNNFNSVTKSN